MTKTGFLFGLMAIAGGGTAFFALQQSQPNEAIAAVQHAPQVQTENTVQALIPQNNLGSTEQTNSVAEGSTLALAPSAETIDKPDSKSMQEQTTANLASDIDIEPVQIAAAKQPLDASELQIASEQLRSATLQVNNDLPLGPLKACFDQMRAIGCPIAGSIPVVKDIVGTISLELGISCPTITSPQA